MAFLVALVAVIALALTACGGEASESPPSAKSAPPAQPAFRTVIDRKLRVGIPKQELAIRCWGAGAPAIVLDAGSGDGGIGAFESYEDELLEPLAKRSTVCAYDRAGTGETTRLPKKRRTVEDQAEELDSLLEAAGVPRPRVLVGSSWGGFVAVQTARDHRAGVAGVVLLDVPAGNAELTAADAPEAAWDHPLNVERVDAFHAERTMARDRRSLGDIPVTIVTADGGQSDKRDQSVWRRLSKSSRQVVLSGGHDIYADDPEGVVRQIARTADAAARE